MCMLRQDTSTLVRALLNTLACHSHLFVGVASCVSEQWREVESHEHYQGPSGTQEASHRSHHTRGIVGSSTSYE